MRSLVFILMLGMFPFSGNGQKLEWDQTTVNFGAVRDWNSPPATFTFKNTGQEKLMFLPQRHDREVLVRYPNHSIRPGESGSIAILFYTPDTGPFSRTVEVYTNASNHPEKLTVKGNIKSIYANALTTCPSFQSTTPAKNGEPNVIQVVDAKTNRPIPGAQIEVFDRGIRKAINGTNLEGVAVNWIEPGKYIGVAYKEGYEKEEEGVVFTKRNRSHVIYLDRTDLDPELNEDKVVASVDDRWEDAAETSDDRFQTPEPIEENVEASTSLSTDLGITTNDILEEEYEQVEELDLSTSLRTDLGITTKEVLTEESIQPESEEEEYFDLGINSNEQWEEATKISDDRSQTQEELVVSYNNQLEEKNDQLQIERQVEAALAEAEIPSTVNEQLPIIEPEPEFSSEKYRPNNVLLLLDVSGSMKDDNKMDKLKSSIRRLVMMLREVDVLTMIAYNSDSWILLPPTPVTDNRAIVELVDSLQPYGYTNGVKGMETAYLSLEKQLIDGGNNQLIIATDGKFNSSKFSEKDAIQLVKDNSDKGIVLSIIGFGEDKEAGRLMKKLTVLGEGNFLQVKNNEDPTELLAEEIRIRSRKR